MSLFLVVEEAKIYRQFQVYAESPVQAKAVVERYGGTLLHSSHPMPGEEEVVEIWIEEASVPVRQRDGSENVSWPTRRSEADSLGSRHES